MDTDDFAREWHEACETAALLLGLPAGLSAAEFVRAVSIAVGSGRYGQRLKLAAEVRAWTDEDWTDVVARMKNQTPEPA